MGSDLRYFSLFSGIGGFEYGMQQSSKMFECIGCSEIDPYAESIYLNHFPNHHNFGDVKKINTDELPKFDLLVGGFPCQSFSIAGSRKGFDDTRGTLFFEIARILRDCRPKYFLLENVRNLVSHDKGNTFKVILKTLSELNYNIEWEVLNSKDYGVPQNRERVFIKGFDVEGCDCDLLNQSRLGNESNKPTNKPYLNCHHFNEISDCLYMTTTTNGDSFAINTKHRSRPLYRKQDNYVLDECGVRRLTPVECERLQGFPDNWTKYGSNGEIISDTQRYKCIGNAVTTKVVTHIIENFKFIK